MKKLPSNIFADSPLRSTESAAPATITAVAAPTEETKGTKSKAKQKTTTLRVAAEEPASVSQGQTRKLTVYLPDEFVQAIDEEVYLRRKGGNRSFSFADLHREVVEEWVTRRAKRS